MNTGSRFAGVVGGVALLLVMSAGPGYAEPTPTPSPNDTATPSATAAAPTPSPDPTPSVTPGSASRTPTPVQRQLQAEVEASLTLSVRSTYGAGTEFWSDIGAYAFRGSASGLTDDRLVAVYWRSASTPSWTRLASGRTANEAYAIDVPVLSHGTFGFIATSGGLPGEGDSISSNTVTVTVGDSRVVFNRPVAEIDALKDPRLSGSIVPARPGVTINIDVLRDGRFVKIDETRTDAAGRFAMNLSYGHGRLSSYRVRATYRVPNRVHWEAALSHSFTRIAVLNGVVTPTTAGEVATTYHSGCPVGRSQLSTITMNYYGADKLMHRGVMIVRSDLTGEVKYGFSRAIGVRFPITRMLNPNAYGGNDPEQMRADNSSGFNCRTVVGNPYRMSPHSYGIALDVNPRQNPYRDINGKWWPENGTEFIDRTPRRLGMLSLDSTLVKVLRNEGFFWGGLWYPGRDYQHFQY